MPSDRGLVCCCYNTRAHRDTHMHRHTQKQCTHSFDSHTSVITHLHTTKAAHLLTHRYSHTHLHRAVDEYRDKHIQRDTLWYIQWWRHTYSHGHKSETHACIPTHPWTPTVHTTMQMHISEDTCVHKCMWTHTYICEYLHSCTQIETQTLIHIVSGKSTLKPLVMNLNEEAESTIHFVQCKKKVLS